MMRSCPLRRRHCLAAVAFGIATIVPAVFGVATAFAADLALMIGVTEYDEKAIRSLEGPNNDVVLMWRELKRRGFQPDDMTVLADNLPQRDDIPRANGPPTRAAIMAGLKAIVERARPDDFVLFQYSGHGTTQPVTDPSAQIEPEPDGRDQVLLPRDAGYYDRQKGSIRNAIIDDELALALDAIRLKGATVWVIVDACHAGTVTRTGGVTRTVPATALGIPSEPGPTTAQPAAARRSGTFVARGAADKGPLIGFFAVDSRTEAIERPFPGFAPGLTGRPNDERLGVFTAHLVRALETGKAVTFRDLARLVSLDMAKLQGAASAPLPVFDGDLDRPIGGGRSVPAVRFPATMRDTSLVIAGGSLHGFEVDAGLALYEGPLREARRLGTAHVTEATPATSLAAVDRDSSAVRFDAQVWVEIETPAVSFAFRVARPGIPVGVEGARIDRVIDAAISSGPGRQGIAVELVGVGDPADLRLTIQKDRIWVVPEGQPLATELDQPGASISLDLSREDAALASLLRRTIWSMARAANLIRLASASVDSAGASVVVEVEVIRESDPIRTVDERRVCTELSKPQATERLTPGVPFAVGHCDVFTVGLKNNGDKDMDVAVFYVDAHAQIGLVDERMSNNGCVMHLPAAMKEPFRLPTRQFAVWEDGKPLTVGLQRLLVFGIPREGTSPPSLCHLRGTSLEVASRSASRSGATARGFARLLSAAGLANGLQRSGNPTFVDDESGGSGAMVRQFTFDLRLPARRVGGR
jgi:Caspase domain